MSIKLLPFASVTCLSLVTAACGDFIRQDRAPVTLVVDALEAASGPSTTFGGTLQSDVQTIVDDVPTQFSDNGRVTMHLVMKDNAVAPSPINAVTINRYRVTFRRADGRNTPGVDVPHPFDSAATFTIVPGAPTSGGFELIRHIAKSEAPLAALINSYVIISTIAEVTFYGRDQAGNNISATGSIGIQFGNFADPD